MNKTTRDIMEYCGCSRDWALQIQQRMADNGFDFSEATTDAFHRAIINADIELLRETGTSPFDTLEVKHG